MQKTFENAKFFILCVLDGMETVLAYILQVSGFLLATTSF